MEGITVADQGFLNRKYRRGCYRKFLRSRGIEKKDLEQNFKYFVSNAVGIDIMEEEFEEFCYNHLVYGKRKLIRVFEIVIWLKESIGIKVKDIQLGYKKILADMNESLTSELLGAIPSCSMVDLMKDFFFGSRKKS